MAEKGSKIFGDTVPFQKKYADELKAKMDTYLSKIGLQSVLVGSNSDPDRAPEDMASDLDTMVDLDDIIQKLTPTLVDKKDTIEKAARRALASSLQDLGLQTSQAGVNVFVRLPYGPNVHQVDLECIRKVGKVSRYHQHRIPKGSPYKGVNKQLAVATLAKQQGYVYSAWEGLYKRTPENKKGELVTDDWDEIAKVLLGQDATGNDLESVEAIFKKLPSAQSNELLTKLRSDPNWKEKTMAESRPYPVGSPEWFGYMKAKLRR